MSGTSHGKTRALEDFRSHVAHRSQTINLWRVLPQPRLKAAAGFNAVERNARGNCSVHDETTARRAFLADSPAPLSLNSDLDQHNALAPSSHRLMCIIAQALD
jgi:hypothetical protein